MLKVLVRMKPTCAQDNGDIKTACIHVPSNKEK